MPLSSTTAPFRIERAAILGVGLIGGSVGLAARHFNSVERIAGWDIDPRALVRARELGAIDIGFSTFEEAVHGADLVILATPVPNAIELVSQLKPHLKPNAIVTDVCSAKNGISSTGLAALGGRFVPGHPMAGSERSGIEAATATLFERKVWAICGEKSDPACVETVALFASSLGAQVEPFPLDLHDSAVGLVSHLPHLLSFAFLRSAEASEHSALFSILAGGGYRDFTRIGRSDPSLWAGILLANREATLRALQKFEEELARTKTALENGDFQALKSRLAGSASK